MLLKMSAIPQHAHYMRVVNLSEGWTPAPRRCHEPSGANAARSATSVFVAVLTKSLRLTAEDCLTTEGRSSAGPQKTRKRALNKDCVAHGGMAPWQREPPMALQVLEHELEAARH